MLLMPHTREEEVSSEIWGFEWANWGHLRWNAGPCTPAAEGRIRRIPAESPHCCYNCCFIVAPLTPVVVIIVVLIALFCYN